MDPLDDGVRMHPIVVLELAKKPLDHVSSRCHAAPGDTPHAPDTPYAPRLTLPTRVTFLTRLKLLTRLTHQQQGAQDRPV